tara:strand:- start:4855 stop:5757 length:903 start_codon:yes stop_codon:yes gene_type:complete
MKLAIGVPWNQEWGHTRFWASMLDGITQEIPRRVDWRVIRGDHRNTWASRSQIVADALEWKADYVLFLDADQTFETPRFIERMLSVRVGNEKETPDILAGIVYKPAPPFSPLVWVQHPAISPDSDFIQHSWIPPWAPNTDEAKQSVFRAEASSAGCMLIRAEVFRQIEKPWFVEEWEYGPHLRTGVEWKGGHDIGFCKKAYDHGFTLWIDPFIQIGHWRQIQVNYATCCAYNASQWWDDPTKHKIWKTAQDGHYEEHRFEDERADLAIQMRSSLCTEELPDGQLETTDIQSADREGAAVG